MSGRVAIAGGGLAGIAAALDLADAGAQVTLLEVRPRLGGAAYSFERDGMTIDNGQHVFLRCCTQYRALLERLGSAGLTELQPRLSIPVVAPGGVEGRLERSDLPAPLHLAGALARYPHLTPAERLSATRCALALRRVDPDDPGADRLTFGEWLGAHGQSERAVEALWDLIALPTLNVPAAEASLALAAFVFQTGLLRERDAADIGWAAVPLQRIHGDPAERALARAGVEVRTRCRVEAVRSEGAGGFAVEAGGERLAADAVVVALPNERAAALLPEGAVDGGAERLRALGSSPIVNIHVVYDRRVMEHSFAAGVRSPVQFVFDRTRGADVGDGQYLVVSLSGAEAEMEEAPERLRERYLPALAELFPRAREARVERLFATREHAATFRAAPGQAALRPGPRTRLPGLVLAGAWTATGWPATMEGAVRSGHAAARVALEALERPRAAAEVVA
ncbi:MAG: FAD-dependent oxidoreductase [Thermoleophilaceae bacterium]|nr:FAD-dependent oxidoreductase [Thermoleophilaceae bacterium]